MRLFLAIDFDDHGRTAIEAEQRRLTKALGSAARALRWVGREQMHVTLIFIGEVDDDRAATIATAVRPPIDRARYVVVLRGLGVFPERGAPRTLWTALASGAEETIDVHRTMSERLERVGVPRETRPFHPHLTLARWRSSRPSERRLIAAANTGGEIARTSVAAVTLYRSQLSASAPVYTVLARAELQS